MKTKGYVILLIIVVAAGFSFIGIILFHDPVIVKQRSEIVFLDIANLKEASDSIIDSQKGPAVDRIFPAGHQNSKKDTVPWVDVYLCHSFSKADSLSGDTLILILDTEIDNSLYKIKYPDEYWVYLKKKTRKYTKCRIMISPEQLAIIKNAKYKFANVELITDDDGLK